MEVTVYGENRYPDQHLFVHYVVEQPSATELIEIFRQCLPYMPRYEPGDVIKFSFAGEEPQHEARYVVDRVVNYIVSLAKQPVGEDIPPFQNQIYVILKPQPLLEGSELPVRPLIGQYDLDLTASVKTAN